LKAWLSLLGSLAFLSLAPLAADLTQRLTAPRGVQAGMSATEMLGGEVGKGFARPVAGRRLQIPQDHGYHPDFRTEWWYFTGNLDGQTGGFGYELTLFRQALLDPWEQLEPRTSKWAAPQVIMGHFAVSDLSKGRFFHDQRLQRSALGLAGCQPYAEGQKLVWVEDWSIQALNERKFHLMARAGEHRLDLTLDSLKSPVFQGQNGYSRKGGEPDQASHYYSLTRLRSRGNLATPDGGSQAVQGWSWMDREWSTRPLGKDLVGWDWFALQFDDGRELMYYQLRDRQGQPTRWSSGSWVERDGSVVHLDSTGLALRVLDHWDSPLDDTRYPSRWEIDLKGQKLRLKVFPRLANQELSGMGRYWEGAVEVEGLDQAGQRVSGRGYVELVGYDNAPKN